MSSAQVQMQGTGSSFYASQSKISTEDLELKLHVLYTYSSAQHYKHLYDDLRSKYPQAIFVLENYDDVDKRKNTVDQIMSIVKDVPIEKDGYELLPFFSFMVDDMIFFKELNLLECVSVLQEQQKAYSLHLKLSPSICYSHTNNKLMNQPTFEPILKQNQPLSSLKFLKYRRSETELDWNYPFDFCGSIYRTNQLNNLITKIDPSKLTKPNLFESAGNVAIRMNMLAKDYPYCLCMNAPHLTVITINKVQEVYNTPVY